jgi:hypothetical protein
VHLFFKKKIHTGMGIMIPTFRSNETNEDITFFHKKKRREEKEK